MPLQKVEFQFITGLRRSIFKNVRLTGSWNSSGLYSDQWSEIPMQQVLGEDGCPAFKKVIEFDSAEKTKTFKWGVILDTLKENNIWGIPTEIQDINSSERYRKFKFNNITESIQVERFYLTYLRRLGANKYFKSKSSKAKLRFAVWAPNALSVHVVFGKSDSGYISNNDTGIDPAKPILDLVQLDNGIWEVDSGEDFGSFKSLPYMYRIVNAQGNTVYRTDIYSRSQMGKGSIDPAHDNWSGTLDSLDGTVSCSVIIDPDVVRKDFKSAHTKEKINLIPAAEFWKSEFTPGLPVPARIEDLIIYELHVGSLGFGKTEPGNLGDAIKFLDHLVDLGINAVELLPMAEFSGNISWGYGDSHHFCIESSAGGRDKYRHFVRECHRHGIAVIQDVVYNHYDNNSERAEWKYDSELDEQNIYYWYEGHSSDYASPDGGYLSNGSTGYTPRFWEEIVRQQFISSAAFLIEEMHVDGLRVDLTQAIHRDNVLNTDRQKSIGNANIFGQKFLREWSRTLHMINSNVILVAEDHTGWDAVTKAPDLGGLGFDSTWDAAFYHSLIGDSDMAGGYARLLKTAGFGGGEPLQIDSFSDFLYESQYKKIVFHESHDEAGNAPGTARTIVVACNDAPLIDDTRRWAEARSRLCFGLSILSAGTPMFFMGEEIGAQKQYTFNNFILNREDIIGERTGNGKLIFRFYQDIISLTRQFNSIRSHNIDIIHNSNSNRIIAFKRWSSSEQIIVIASFNNNAFSNGYIIEKDLPSIPNGNWKEIFNSDSEIYGGENIGNSGASIQSAEGHLNVIIPACGFVVFMKQ